MTDEPEVLIRIEGAVGRITLNRPQALHALNTNMVRLITEALVTWIDNPIVKLVLIDHAGERGFCAGGDIRMLAASGAGDGRGRPSPCRRPASACSQTSAAAGTCRG
jgi:enoyl-CoA hydratase